MEYLINKDILVSEIERRIHRNNEKAATYSSNSEHNYLYRVKNAVYKDLLSFINTLKVKEDDNMIEKTCKYLKTHLWQSVDDDNDPIVESVQNITLDNFIKDFKRYLEE